ncbi:unnamed protein product [Protopolystoma xenopodis]|uniref:Uncharacterized protein n=1 Tax=Protopolystoma xenopodis TaxID=117903 RepID=A0A448XKZ6_9PLAT|nr:unnamed protein product [Protopolystoma xenopodis]
MAAWRSCKYKAKLSLKDSLGSQLLKRKCAGMKRLEDESQQKPIADYFWPIADSLFWNILVEAIFEAISMDFCEKGVVMSRQDAQDLVSSPVGDQGDA